MKTDKNGVNTESGKGNMVERRIMGDRMDRTTRLEKALEHAEKHIPEKHRALFIKAANGSASPRKMIKALCQNCVCYSEVTTAIRDCSSYICPVWNERPYQE